jgi:hypothetical protein
MIVNATITNLTKVEAKTTGVYHWVAFSDGDSMIKVFCPSADAAKVTADAFNRAMSDSQTEAAQ